MINPEFTYAAVVILAAACIALGICMDVMGKYKGLLVLSIFVGVTVLIVLERIYGV